MFILITINFGGVQFIHFRGERGARGEKDRRGAEKDKLRWGGEREGIACQGEIVKRKQCQETEKWKEILQWGRERDENLRSK